jgi:site-specific recombinase XerC
MKETLHQKVNRYIDMLTVEIKNCEYMIETYKKSDSFALALQEQSKLKEKKLNKKTLIDILK